MEHEVSIKSFTDLDTWKQGHILVLRVYELTRLFPKEEQFGLTNQLRRAVVSLTSNITEGFSRLSYNDKAHFYTMAHGSLTEAQNQLIVARDVKYITTDRFDQIAQQSVVVHKLLTGLIKSTKQRKAAA